MASEVEAIIGRELDPNERAAEWNPPTLDLDQPRPGEIGAAVAVLWELTRRLRDELAELRARVDAQDRAGG